MSDKENKPDFFYDPFYDLDKDGKLDFFEESLRFQHNAQLYAESHEQHEKIDAFDDDFEAEAREPYKFTPAPKDPKQAAEEKTIETRIMRVIAILAAAGVFLKMLETLGPGKVSAGSFVLLLLVLAAMAAICVIIDRYFKRKSESEREALRQWAIERAAQGRDTPADEEGIENKALNSSADNRNP